MADEIALTVDGRDAVLSVRQSMWHGKGVVLPYAPSFEEAIKIAQLDYTVEKRATYLALANGGYAKSAAFVTARADTEKELGVVQDGYTVVQNVDAFRVLRPVLDQGLAEIETAGVLRGGADAWMLLKLKLSEMPDVVQKVFTKDGDLLNPYLLVANNHSGRRGILAAMTIVRVVCANTLGAAEMAGVKDQIVVKHSKNAEVALIDAAEQLWGRTLALYSLIAQAYQELREFTLSPNQFQRLCVSVVAPNPQEHANWTPEARMADSVVHRFEQRKELLEKLWVSGAGHVGDHSAWEAYNAVAEALDHHTSLWPTRGGVFRTASALDGKIKTDKERVFANLYELAKK